MVDFRLRRAVVIVQVAAIRVKLNPAQPDRGGVVNHLTNYRRKIVVVAAFYALQRAAKTM